MLHFILSLGFLPMKIDINILETKAEILRAAAHPLRIAILTLLQIEKECTVSQIYAF